ncbi:MAG: IS110 family transposase [Pseudomonadota bacterium]
MKSDSQENPCFGVDVGSEHLDIAVFGSHEVKRIANEAKAIRKWLDAVPLNSRLALESTGSYHLTLATLAHARGVAVYLLNPRDIKHYAQSLGQRGKTDRLDARVIARFIEREHAQLRTWQPLSPQQQKLDDLIRQRALLQKQHAAQKQALKHRGGLKETMADVLKSMQQALDRLERMIGQAARELPSGDVSMRSLISIPGIGTLTAAALLRLFSRAADASADAIVALTGLDPRPMDSGNKRGVRRLSKRGEPEIRRLLYTASMSGAKTQTWLPYYERERAKKLSSTAALMALARRILRVAYSLFKTGQQFDKTRSMA